VEALEAAELQLLATAEPITLDGERLVLRANVDLPEEAELQRAAKENNRDFMAALWREARRSPAEFGELPVEIYDEVILRDAWGTPIVFMPGMHPAIGIALEDRPFFLSAGPDGRFRTLEDNLYSYEEGRDVGG